MLYDCRVCRVMKSSEIAWVQVEAESEEQAEEKALEIDDLDWAFVDGQTEQIEVMDITPVGGER